MARVADRDSIAHTVRRRVVRSSECFWRNEDFKGEADAVEITLRRLVAEGELERIRRGVFWRGRPTRFGMSAPSPVAAVLEVLGDAEAVGAAEWYATNLLGLSTQVSPVPVVAVSRRAPTGFAHVRLVDRASRTARRDARLNDFEVTLLEALDGWDRFVEVDAASAATLLLAALTREEVRMDRLVKASRTEPPKVRERLRWLLTRAGRDDQASRIDRARSRAGRDTALAVVGDS
jgi:hypothetical protein